ncbi:cytochrome c biogenesis protein CcdA [Aquibacillus sp. 3ASR75-11]|uniref:Cytochrome c biogenesis protein CcdA n=1 Tax=Terrihalobacillus insolitus TaxID=2950438 RepID=A0A9X4AMC4_9BACI|nr:cytochrome c biogenesis protein CcdA [Terrihalobacillus insolitus]MDC3411946.1 cytochrome c biogenesis protein CcdA [Terrihalobacillus insolitus]MDC3423368.1 cytochrome c biogenesis protein CcdA [Terrihalobacillus insolitus]
MNPADVSIWLAFFAGVLSFVSPCMLPLYPSYLSYITGVSVQDIKQKGGKLWWKNNAVAHTLFFIIGFSIIFIALGLSASLVGRLFYQYKMFIQVVGGTVIFIMGLFMIGIIKSKWLMMEKRYQFRNRPTGYLGSILIGIVFAAGWTPCIGPILTGILMLSATNPTSGLWMTIFYILGFSIPFFLMSFFIGRLKWVQRHSVSIMKVGGVIMLLVGILLMTNQMTKITVWLINLYGGFTGF